MKVITSLLGITMTTLLVFSCQKETSKSITKNPNTTSNPYRGSAIWGIAPHSSNGTVWKWNGSSWFQPNAAARLCDVSVGIEGGVWGLTNSSGTYRIWKWDGSSWYQPNSAAGLYSISACSPTTAWGIGGSNRIFKTTNGGASWSEPNSAARLKQVAVGGPDNVWGLGLDRQAWKWNGSSWSPSGLMNLAQVSASRTAPIAWALTYYGDGSTPVLKITTNGSTFSTVSTPVSFFHIDAGEDGELWAMGPGGSIWKTTNYGASWVQPNPAASLLFVSVGQE